MSGNWKAPLRQLEEPALERGYDPFSRVAIAVGTVGVRHALVFTVVVQELHHGREDSLSTRADEARSTRLDRLRPFGRVAYNEYRLPQRRGLLLNTPGIRDDQICAHHQIDERRSEEHTSELQSQSNLVCRLLLEKKKNWQQKVSAGLTTYEQHALPLQVRVWV